MNTYAIAAEHARALDLAIHEWDPRNRDVLCRNCINAKVGRRDDAVIVSCAAGIGRPMALIKTLRKNSRGFSKASDCAEFAPSFDPKPAAGG